MDIRRGTAEPWSLHVESVVPLATGGLSVWRRLNAALPAINSAAPKQATIRLHREPVQRGATLKKGRSLPLIMAAPNTLRIGQLNLGGSAMATQELPAIAGELGLDIILVQEQYSQTQPSMAIIQFGDSPKAGIYVASRRVGVVALQHLCTQHCVVAAIQLGTEEECVVVSAYFQYSQPIDGHLQHLERVLTSLNRGRRVVVGADVNAHSPLWHSAPRHYIGRGHETDHRRRSMEDFISSMELIIHNQSGYSSTFSGPNGESNIDVTLSTRCVLLDQWQVHDSASSSDHRLISYSILASCSRRAAECAEPVSEPPRFRVNGVDWDRFRAAIWARMGYLRSNMPASVLAREFTEVVVRTAHVCLGVKGNRWNTGYEWWSPKLDRQRKLVARLRNKWQRTRKRGVSVREESLREEFHAERRKYRQLMVEEQNNYHLQIAESGNADPYGQAYRVASGRFRPPPNVVNGVKFAEGYPEGVSAAAKNLMHALCPDDDSSQDTEYHRHVRIAAALVPSGSSALPLSIGDLWTIVKSLPNTAPGIDGITARILKHVWGVASVEFHRVYASCVVEGVFPDVWKDGRLIVIPKGNDKPLTDPKAYRPITLLPVLGKILERVMLKCAPQITKGISDFQHGFSPGKSTVSALQAILSTAKTTKSNYVQAIFLDISGAFDNAWWPMILLKAKRGGCPPNIYRMLESYFQNRRVGLYIGERVVWKTSTMGCPQGSVLGPTLWNVLLDDLLRLPLPGGVRVVAYADDVTILIEADTRRAIETAAADTIQQIEDWGRRNRLAFAPSKSQTMTFKGKLGKRPPVIKLGGSSIRRVTEAVVLGVTIDANLSFAQHALSIGERAGRCFGKMSRVSTSSWGIRYPALRILYQGTFVATIAYAAACWARRSALHVVRSTLIKAQRSSLILLTKAYRSASSAALAVLAGVLPADLEVIRAARIDEARQSAPKSELSRRKREIGSEVIAMWQERWSAEIWGGELRRFFPDVSNRLGAVWVAPDYETSQILIGHGCFRARLHRMTLCESPECECGSGDDEDRHHALWECPLYGDLRANMLDGVVRAEAGPVFYTDLVSSAGNFNRLREFAHQWHKRRSSSERLGARQGAAEVPRRDLHRVAVPSSPQGGRVIIGLRRRRNNL